MMQKIQRFGAAMFVPVLLFAFAGVTAGLSILFMNQDIMGSIADPNGLWYKVLVYNSRRGVDCISSTTSVICNRLANRISKKSASTCMFRSFINIFNI